MNKIPVQKGDVYFVKSGLVHAIDEGVVIAEIQQNSDTTYRVYDYNRGRELHIDKALDVVDLSLRGEKSQGLKLQQEGFSKTYYCLCEHFALELYEVAESFKECSDSERFYIFTAVEGEGEILSKDNIVTIKKGDSILIPAALGKYEIRGTVKLLKSYVPNMEKVEEEILNKVVVE
jgi:mannose-6-phosphate isomerase